MGGGELPRRRRERDVVDKMPPWTAGSHYGPVLDAFQMKVVGAKLELNPLLAPAPDQGPEADRTHLNWNMLMAPSLVHRSCDPVSVSWSGGRSEPATFPRINELKIVSEHYPWLVEIKAQDINVGVTCGEVIDGLATNMEKLTSKTDFEALPGNLRKVVLEAYRYNRSRNPDVPGGKMGEGLKRADFLGQMTSFGGLEVNEAAVEKVCKVVVPGYVVLRCLRREFMTQADLRAQEARARAASQVPSSARSASARGVRRRGAGSTAESTPSTSGIGIGVEDPSDSEDYSGSED
ncbi:hypothetical protein P691DRAFT_813049 [Macrolepiota fuliginosa MF-IS2]|uniref:DUF6699 domain-containing protein n=1 Tax=Macrolepiota fuliginosa MF-IS2 TaxID=1400762 RepID=A0A9P6C980_9AGAR|nr:hypothetical protein P691DRAFT_813049 [Macrolepiota fuliginosa MF-IS2]